MMKQPAPFNGKSDLISGRLADIGRETSVSNHYFPILFRKISRNRNFEMFRIKEPRNNWFLVFRN